MTDFHSPTPRNWLELPRDVMLTILTKLTIFELLESAQLVCKSWQNIIRDPSLWRIIELHNSDEPEQQKKYEGLVYRAIDYSSGGLISLDIEGFGTNDLLAFVADRSHQLKRLRLACCYSISAEALIEASRKLLLLEELELTLSSFSEQKILHIIHSFPMLKTFNLNEQGYRNPEFACDEEALAIAESMHELCHLQLIGNSMTNSGLEAILDNCLQLESLDLRACFHVDLSGGLGKRCAEQIKNLRRPEDPTDDYSFLTTDYDSDFDEITAAEYDDVDFVSDNENYEFSDDDLSDFMDDDVYD